MLPNSLVLLLFLVLVDLLHGKAETALIDALNLSAIREAASSTGKLKALHSQLFRWDGVSVGHERLLMFSDGTARTMRTLALKPLVLEVENFLSEDEIEALLAEGKASPMEESRAQKMGAADRRQEYRYSDTAWIRHDAPVATPIGERLAEMAVLPAAWVKSSEPMQFVIYPQGGHYFAHHDSHQLSRDSRSPLRFLTALHALLPAEAGGETCFHLAGGRPKGSSKKPDGDKYERYDKCEGLVLPTLRGNTLLFYNHFLANPIAPVSLDTHQDAPIGAVGGFGDQDEASMHGGCEVLEGTKTVANHWIDFTPKNRILVQPLWGPASSETESMALGALDVGDGVAWVFASADKQGDSIREAAAEVAAASSADGKLRFVYAGSDAYGLNEANFDFNLRVDDFPAVGILQIGDQEKDDKRFVTRISRNEVSEVKAHIRKFVKRWQNGKAQPLSRRQEL